jgi:hypothetical protein
MVKRSAFGRKLGPILALGASWAGSAHADPLTAAQILQNYNVVTKGNALTTSDIEGSSAVGGSFSGATIFNNTHSTSTTSPQSLTVFGPLTNSNPLNINDLGAPHPAPTLFYNGTVKPPAGQLQWAKQPGGYSRRNDDLGLYDAARSAGGHARRRGGEQHGKYERHEQLQVRRHELQRAGPRGVRHHRERTRDGRRDIGCRFRAGRDDCHQRHRHQRERAAQGESSGPVGEHRRPGHLEFRGAHHPRLVHHLRRRRIGTARCSPATTMS